MSRRNVSGSVLGLLEESWKAEHERVAYLYDSTQRRGSPRELSVHYQYASIDIMFSVHVDTHNGYRMSNHKSQSLGNEEYTF